MENRRIRVAITHGDTNGIGYELIFKTFAEPAMLELCTPIVYGSPKVAAYHRNVLGLQANFTIIGKAEDARDGRVNMLTTFDEEVKVEMGNSSPESAKAALKALRRAMDDFQRGVYDALVLGPADATKIAASGEAFTSEQAFIEAKIGNGNKAMRILMNERLRIALATDSLPMKSVAQAITKELILDKATTLQQSLKRDFRISNPRIAVLALNPSSVEGAEENDSIRPAIVELAKKGVQVFGPFAADAFFGNGDYDAFDGVLAMYYEQGATPFRTLDLGNGILMTAGLPIVCTSTDLSAGFDIAGKGVVDENPLRQAIYAAIDIARNRQNYDSPLENPLPKLYHEKRDESEKVRFAIPKKHDSKPAEEKGPAQAE